MSDRLRRIVGLDLLEALDDLLLGRRIVLQRDRRAGAVAGARAEARGLRGVLPRRHQVLRLDRAAQPHTSAPAILFTPGRDPQYCPPGTGEEDTPLFKDDEITRKVFGEYVSTYDFQRAVEDKATVPLYYDARGDDLGISIGDLNERIAEKLEELETEDIKKIVRNDSSGIL